MLIKYRIYEIARDMGVTSKEVIDLLQQFIPVENARKHNSVLHEHELNVVLETLSGKNKVSDIQKYLSAASPLDNKAGEKTPTETTATIPDKNISNESPKSAKQRETVEKKTDRVSHAGVNEKSKDVAANTNSQRFEQSKPHTVLKEGTNKIASSSYTNNKNLQQGNNTKPTTQTSNKFGQGANYQANKGPQQTNNRFNNVNYNQTQSQHNPGGSNDYQGNKDNRNNNQQTQRKSYNTPQRDNNAGGFRQNTNNTNTFNNKKPFVRPPAKPIPDSQKLQGTQTVDIRTVDVNLDKYNEKYEKIAPTNLARADYSNKQKIVQKSAQRTRQQFIKRETESEKLRRLEEQRLKNRPSKIIIPEELVVGELASKLKVPATQVIKKLMMLGIMASVTQIIDFETASLIADEFGVKSEKEVTVTIEDRLFDETEDKKDDLEPRNPVVVVMGHVDHGKTSLLDAIRNADVISTEAGGITQHIGAYRVNIDGRYITFLDTPGHEAFTSMRARGAQITDIAILVVAADDGIMPQTVEAINHAKAAGVSIIVAINKIDKPGANLEKIKQELTEYELVPEEWGGETICVPVSAKTKENIDTLLEMVQLVADVKDLKANPNRLAKGAVIEAKLDKGRGPIATVLVQNGTLRNGDIIIAGTSIGKVRTMLDDRGRKVMEAGPSTPVEITGLSEVPSAGDVFNAVEDERLAKELVDKRKHELKQERFSSYQKVTLDNLFSQISEGEIKDLPVIVKADVNGSVEAIRQSLEKLSNQEVRVRVIHGGVGAINKSDVMLANASNAIIIGFNVRPDPVARDSAALDGVDIRFYRVIYDAIDEIKSAMKGMLAPKVRELELGRVEVRQVYKVSNIGSVAGCYVTEGKITRNAKIRVVRDGVVIADDVIKSLKRFKDDVKEVAQGYECGICLEKFNDIKDHDILEAYMMEEYRDE